MASFRAASFAEKCNPSVMLSCKGYACPLKYEESSTFSKVVPEIDAESDMNICQCHI